MDSFAIAASGIRSAEVRMAASAHNVANLTTESFRPLRTQQSALQAGGSTASAIPFPSPDEVDLLREHLEQFQSKLQFQGSLRVFSAASEMSGSLVDLLA